jgi:metal-sulfur cluster biosynthetic enzyme
MLHTSSKIKSIYRETLALGVGMRRSHSLHEESIIRQNLANVIEPITQQSLISLGITEKIACHNRSANVKLQLLVPGYPYKTELSQRILKALSPLSWIERVSVEVSEAILETKLQLMSTGLAKVKHVIAISSCKGSPRFFIMLSTL